MQLARFINTLLRLLHYVRNDGILLILVERWDKEGGDTFVAEFDQKAMAAFLIPSLNKTLI